MSKVLPLLCLLVLTGCSSTASLPEDAYQGEADAVVALAFAADPVLNAPDDSNPAPSPDDWKKPGAECRNCFGTGRTGDGITRCQVCGGDGRIDERDIRDTPPEIGSAEPLAEEATSKRTIVMHVTTETAAGWPQEWWRETRPQLVAQGWEVSVVRDEKLQHAEPWFEVCEDDTCRPLIGDQPPEAFK